MATFDFNKQLDKDAQDIFLSDDFSVTAILKSGESITEIQVQFFEEPLDKMGATFYHAWCAFKDMPYVTRNEATLEIDKIVYGIVDFSPDDTLTGVDLFLQKA